MASSVLDSLVKMTCNILRELGENLKSDKDSKFETAANVADECKKVYLELEGELDGIDGLNKRDEVTYPSDRS